MLDYVRYSKGIGQVFKAFVLNTGLAGAIEAKISWLTLKRLRLVIFTRVFYL